MKTWQWAAAIVVTGAAAGGAWWMTGPDKPPTTGSVPLALRPDDVTLTAQGAPLYRQHCASCHGDALQGQPNWRERGPDGLLPAPPHDASGHTWHHTDELLVRITRDGVAAIVGDPGYRTAMPVYRGVLSDEQIVAVLSWIKSQWPADVRAKHDRLNAQPAR